MKKWVFSFCIAAFFLTLCSWGFLVHRTVNQLAIYALPKGMQAFFFSNKDSLVYNAPRPDIRRNTQKDEAAKHYLDFEAYGDSAYYKIPHNLPDAITKYTLDTLKEYGTLPFVVIETYEKLTRAFKNKNADSILYYAADLGHYISDAHVPLHTSLNYDGQLTNQHGMHDLWETTVPEAVITSYKLASRHRAKHLASPAETIWKIMAHTHALTPEVFAKEIEVSKQFTDTSRKYRWEVRWGKNRRFYSKEFAIAYNKALAPTINHQIIASANAIADFWYTAWHNAGKPDLAGIITRDYNKRQFKNERKAFKKNELIKNRWLISVRGKNKD